MKEIRPLRADEIEVRVGTVSAKGVTLLLYKNARVDMTILDEIVGPLNWKREHSRDNANCTVSIWNEQTGQWVSKEDTGTESYTEKEKGLASDSFKRACTNWGIGRELYESPFIFCPTATKKKESGRGYELVNPYEFSGAYVNDIDYEIVEMKRVVSKLSIVVNDVEIFKYPKGPTPKKKITPAVDIPNMNDLATDKDKKFIKDMCQLLGVAQRDVLHQVGITDEQIKAGYKMTKYDLARAQIVLKEIEESKNE